LLRLRSWLGDDDGDVAASGRGVGEPGRQQRGMHTPAAVCGRGRRTGKLRDALGYAHGGAACENPIPQPGVPYGDAVRCHIPLDLDYHFARELVMPGHPWRVGMDGALGYDVQPRLGLLRTARPDLDPGRQYPLEVTGEGTAEHIFERFQPVTPPGQPLADRGV